ncbi:MAG: Gfo/Idh/MocA family oxidoreductase [Planctomycetota bacterium]
MSTDRQDDVGINRRSFSSGALVGAASLLAAKPSDVHAAESSVIRVGLVGCGGRGTGAAINAMRADPSVRIVALADLFDSAMQKCRKGLGERYADQFIVDDDHCFEGFEGYKTLLQSDVDVVLLCSPPYYRPDHIEASVEAGKEIFCEKPVATDAAGVTRVREACKKADEKSLNVVSGLCWRYDRGMQETVKRVHDGEIGTLISVQANYLTNPIWKKTRKPGEDELMYQCRNWYNYAWLSGDHIVEQHIHSIDKVLWLHRDKPPQMAYGMGGRMNRSDLTEGDIYDHFAVVYEWPDQTRAYTYTRQMRGCFNETKDFAFGSLGRASLTEHVIDGVSPWKFEGEEVQMHQAEQNEFFKAVRGERERINNGEYMCNSTLMAILGREVCYSGKKLLFEDVAQSGQRLGPVELVEGGAAPDVRVKKPGRYDPIS